MYWWNCVSFGFVRVKHQGSPNNSQHLMNRDRWLCFSLHFATRRPTQPRKVNGTVQVSPNLSNSNASIKLNTNSPAQFLRTRRSGSHTIIKRVLPRKGAQTGTSPTIKHLVGGESSGSQKQAKRRKQSTSEK